MCQNLEKVQRGIQEENRQAGKQRDEFMRQLSTVIERLRRDGEELRQRPAFWCGGFWDNRRHYSVAGQIGTAAGQRRNRRNDPAQSWRPKSAGQRAGKEDCHGAQGGRSRGRTENELNDFPPALRKSQVLGGIFNRTLQKMIRINKEKLLLGPPSNIAGLKTIIECFHGS